MRNIVFSQSFFLHLSAIIQSSLDKRVTQSFTEQGGTAIGRVAESGYLIACTG